MGHKAVWSERYEELKQFRKVHGHCNVPSRYHANHQLAIWVKRQRRQWKNKMDFRKNCMTDERQESLDSIGFIWDMTSQRHQGRRGGQGLHHQESPGGKEEARGRRQDLR